MKLNTWLRNTFLARKIDYDFEFQDKEYNKPEDLILTAGPMVSHYENIYSLDAVNNGWNKDWSKHLDSLKKNFLILLVQNMQLLLFMYWCNLPFFACRRYK